MKKIALLLFVFTITIFTGAKAQSHPAYLHALSDLRAARWMLEHRPGDWKQTEDEISAVKKIDDAIGEIKKAAIDDGKDLNDHPAAQEINEHAGRLKKAMEYLQRARGDIDKEDDIFANGLRKRAMEHINQAIGDTKKAMANVR